MKNNLKNQMKISFKVAIFSFILLGVVPSGNANQITELNGEIQLKREGNDQFDLANVTDDLDYGDELQIGTDSSVVIVCRNTDRVKIEQPGIHLVSEYCSEGEPTEPIDNNDDFQR